MYPSAVTLDQPVPSFGRAGFLFVVTRTQLPAALVLNLS